MTAGSKPARPWKPIQEGPILFISEAPPVPGGFWAPRPVKDGLRHNLLAILEGLGLPVPADKHSCEALYCFLWSGLFLVQTIKWPINPSFNHLGGKRKRALVEHSVDSHLRSEVEIVKPRGIIALGSAAWAACSRLHPGQEALPDSGVEELRSEDFELDLGQERAVPLNVTSLPVGQNVRYAGGSRGIGQDISRFLRRIGWRGQPQLQIAE